MSPVPSRLPPPHPTGGRITLTLPVPPSVNKLYHTLRGGRVYKDAKAVTYGKVAATYAMANRIVPILSGDVELRITWHRAKKIGDVDNRLKVLIDSIKGGVCLGDDKQVRKLSIERVDGEKAAGVELLILEWGVREK